MSNIYVPTSHFHKRVAINYIAHSNCERVYIQCVYKFAASNFSHHDHFLSSHRVLRCMRTLALLLIQIIFSPILYLEGSNIMVYNVTLIYIWAYKREISLLNENKYISQTNLCFNFGRRVWISLNYQYEWIEMKLIIHRNNFSNGLKLVISFKIKTNPIFSKHLKRT